MENPSCNYCSSKSYIVFLDNLKSRDYEDVFRLVKCKKCGLVYLNPRPTKKSIAKYYPSSSYWSENPGEENRFSYLFDFILPEIKKGMVLDIGSGTGLFLNGFKRRGWKVEGIEPSGKAVKEALRKYKIKLVKGDLRSVKLPLNHYDLVTLNNVLEHLHNPSESLGKIYTILKKDGMLMISCPNIDSFGAGIFKNKWYGIDAPRHLYQFNRDTLSDILRKNGFKIIKSGNNFRKHNYDIVFESFRLKFSPRFSNVRDNRNEKKLADSTNKTSKSLKGKIGIIISKIFSTLVTLVEPLFFKGEIITVLATKI